MKSYEYQELMDNRELDVWGNPIGKKYRDKNWEELTPEEMKADFDWKNDILSVQGERVDCDTFYQDYLFRELYEGTLPEDYKVMLTEYDAEASQKVHKVDVDEIQDYLHLDDVALSPCLFHCNWRRKKLLNYVSAFVLDIDKLRPKQLQRFFKLFDEGRLLRPTFIANSGSGVHFYYMLDQMLRCDSVQNEANNLIATEIYRCLYDDVIKKEKWRDAQRHWLGQDYRVVNSKTKLHQTSQIFKVGDLYTVEQLIEHYDIKINPKKHYATKSMIKYASGIAKNLQIEPPDFTNAKQTYDFITIHKDEAYQVREARRRERAEKQKGKKKPKRPVTWYKNTLHYMQDHTQEGFRFSSMKALAIIAFKEKVPRDVFLHDIRELAAYWETFDWKGDKFNQRNVEAIVRLYDKAAQYSNTSSETLEEWLGYEFKRIGIRRNGRKQAEHLKMARLVRDEVNGHKDTWINKDGAPTKAQVVLEWRKAHPDGRKADCIRETGLTKPTVYKWWNGEEEAKKKQPAKAKKDNVKIKFDTPAQETAATEIAARILQMPEEEQKKFWEMLKKAEENPGN